MESDPTPGFLLGTGLDTLHKESREWLETIAFWKDEIHFFKDLLEKRKEGLGGFSEYGKILEDLYRVHADLFDYLADDIVDHEIFLARLLKDGKGISDNDYREKHQELKSRIDLFTRDFRAFKRMIFGYAKAL